MLTEEEVVDQLTSFYQTLDEAISERAPAWRGEARPQHRRQSWQMQLLATAALLALFIGVGVLIREGRLLNPKTPVTSPAPNPAIKVYQTMVGTDEAVLIHSEANHCDTIHDTGCLAAAAIWIDASQHWLDDLNTSRPPARFARVDAQARRNLAQEIADLKALVTAYRVQDQIGMDAAFSDAIATQEFLVVEVSDILGSVQGTTSTYTETVRVAAQQLKDCQPCQDLLSQPQVNCQPAEMKACQDNMDAARYSVERFQGDLLRLYAPSSLATKDARLQADLFRADQALVAMTAALRAGDHNQLQTNYEMLMLALTAVNSEAADISPTNAQG